MTTKSETVFLFPIVFLLLLSSCKKTGVGEEMAYFDRLIDSTYKQKDYNRLVMLTDSLLMTGDISDAKACYWQGCAYDRLKQKDKANEYWTLAMKHAEESDNIVDGEYYEKSASRLANLLCLERDFKGVLKMAMPAVKYLEEHKRDTTSDYINLLIYIGLSQVSTGANEEDTENAFFIACQKHKENISRTHTDEAYKDAIAGLINIAYYCIQAEKYKAALYYTGSFGELLGEYQQRPDVDETYIDKQIGRYTIYKAQALQKLGRTKDAADTYKVFLDTKFSQTSEGYALAQNYQSER